MVVAGMAEFAKLAFTGFAFWRVQYPDSIGGPDSAGACRERRGAEFGRNIQ
jgi:hypothetical protein